MGPSKKSQATPLNGSQLQDLQDQRDVDYQLLETQFAATQKKLLEQETLVGSLSTQLDEQKVLIEGLQTELDQDRPPESPTQAQAWFQRELQRRSVAKDARIAEMQQKLDNKRIEHQKCIKALETLQEKYDSREVLYKSFTEDYFCTMSTRISVALDELATLNDDPQSPQVAHISETLRGKLNQQLEGARVTLRAEE